MLHITGLRYLLQTNQELLFLLVMLLYFIVLLFEHISIMLGDVRGSRKRYDDAEEKTKNFLFCLYIVNLDTITGFFR